MSFGRLMGFLWGSTFGASITLLIATGRVNFFLAAAVSAAGCALGGHFHKEQ